MFAFSQYSHRYTLTQACPYQCIQLFCTPTIAYCSFEVSYAYHTVAYSVQCMSSTAETEGEVRRL